MTRCSSARTGTTTARARPSQQGGEGRKARGLDFRMGGERLVGAELPVGEEEDFPGAVMVESEVGGEAFGLFLVGGQHQQGGIAGGEQGSGQLGAARAEQTEYFGNAGTGEGSRQPPSGWWRGRFRAGGDRFPSTHFAFLRKRQEGARPARPRLGKVLRQNGDQSRGTASIRSKATRARSRHRFRNGDLAGSSSAGCSGHPPGR